MLEFVLIMIINELTETNICCICVLIFIKLFYIEFYSNINTTIDYKFYQNLFQTSENINTVSLSTNILLRHIEIANSIITKSRMK